MCEAAIAEFFQNGIKGENSQRIGIGDYFSLHGFDTSRRVKPRAREGVFKKKAHYHCMKIAARIACKQGETCQIASGRGFPAFALHKRMSGSRKYQQRNSRSHDLAILALVGGVGPGSGRGCIGPLQHQADIKGSLPDTLPNL
jgi:hypothetical protein